MVMGMLSVLAAMVSAVICVVSGGFSDLRWLWQLPVCWLAIVLGVLLAAFVMVLIMCRFVDLNKEEEKDHPLYRWMLYVIADAAHTVLRVRVHAQGVEKVPADGRVMLVCNHLNNSDPVLILHQVKKKQKLAFIAKRETAKMFVVGKFMHKLLCQRINRENDREALKTILRCIDIIKQDKASIAVFPEGYIHGDNLLHPFRHGVFKIALRTKVPVVVCTLWGSQDVFTNAAKLKRTDVDFHVVGVVQPEEYAGMTAVELGRRVHTMMAADLGPEKVLPVE